MGKRVFIAIDLPDDIKDGILEVLSIWKNKLKFPIRWIKPENWHLTLVFLGYQQIEDIKLIEEKIKPIVSTFKNFEINLDKIIYGPPGKPPRMIWVKAQSPEYNVLKESIESGLIKAGIKFKKEIRSPNPHLTLARFQESIRIFPEINTQVDLSFKVEKIVLMESQLKSSGAEYIPLNYFNLL